MKRRMESRFVRSASLGGYVELVRSLGHDPHRLLRQAGLSAQLLDNPENRISVDAVRELLEMTAQTTATEDLALRLADTRHLADLGPISLILQDEATPRMALNTLCRYLQLLNSSMVMHVEDAGLNVIVQEELLPGRYIAVRQSVELAIGVMYRILSELIGTGWTPVQVCFTHRAPSDPSNHKKFFGIAVTFGAGFNGIVCAARDLNKRREAIPSAMSRFASNYLERELQRRSLGPVETCRNLILALLPGGRCTAKQLARHLQLDRRTLHRHLSNEGVSFAVVLDQVRREIVLRHLQESDLSLTEISGLLGFSSPSGLSHWFRSEFGTSITDWRRTQKPMRLH